MKACSKIEADKHIDMDAFYASVEQRDHPKYQGKSIAVGGSPEDCDCKL